MVCDREATEAVWLKFATDLHPRFWYSAWFIRAITLKSTSHFERSCYSIHSKQVNSKKNIRPLVERGTFYSRSPHDAVILWVYYYFVTIAMLFFFTVTIRKRCYKVITFLSLTTWIVFYAGLILTVHYYKQLIIHSFLFTRILLEPTIS